MSAQRDSFEKVHRALRAIMQPFESQLNMTKDDADHYNLNGHYSAKFGKDLHFGAVKTGKRYVSYHLMPVYMYPELLKAISPALKKRMQGKSCFNFTKIDETLFEELAQLTARGYERFAAQD